MEVFNNEEIQNSQELVGEKYDDAEAESDDEQIDSGDDEEDDEQIDDTDDEENVELDQDLFEDYEDSLPEVVE